LKGPFYGKSSPEGSFRNEQDTLYTDKQTVGFDVSRVVRTGNDVSPITLSVKLYRRVS
jgi:hypothetical protein